MTRHSSKKRGFAALDPEQRRALASKGGKSSHAKGTLYVFSNEQRRIGGKHGGAVVSANVAHMVEIGRKGGSR